MIDRTPFFVESSIENLYLNGSPIKGRVPPQILAGKQEKKHPSIKKIDIFFTCHISGNRPVLFYPPVPHPLFLSFRLTASPYVIKNYERSHLSKEFSLRCITEKQKKLHQYFIWWSFLENPYVGIAKHYPSLNGCIYCVGIGVMGIGVTS